MVARRVMMLAMLVSALAPVAARAATAPGDDQIASLSARFAATRSVRVEGTFGVRDLERPIADAQGLRSAAWDERARRRPGLFVSGDAPRTDVPHPIAWSEIESVRVPRGSTAALKGLLLGTITGVALGALLVGTTTNARDTGEAAGWRAISLFSGSVVVGGAVGAVLGTRRGWETVYAAPSP